MTLGKLVFFFTAWTQVHKGASVDGLLEWLPGYMTKRNTVKWEQEVELYTSLADILYLPVQLQSRTSKKRIKVCQGKSMLTTVDDKGDCMLYS